MVWICLIAILPGVVQGQSWVNPGQTPAQRAETLAAQRKEIEEIKALFARIDERIVQIDRIHQKIEVILNNWEATVACVALEQLTQTKAELSTQYDTASSDAERMKVKKDLDLYKAMFAKAKAAASQFECRE